MFNQRGEPVGKEVEDEEKVRDDECGIDRQLEQEGAKSLGRLPLEERFASWHNSVFARRVGAGRAESNCDCACDHSL